MSGPVFRPDGFFSFSSDPPCLHGMAAHLVSLSCLASDTSRVALCSRSWASLASSSSAIRYISGSTLVCFRQGVAVHSCRSGIRFIVVQLLALVLVYYVCQLSFVEVQSLSPSSGGFYVIWLAAAIRLVDF